MVVRNMANGPGWTFLSNHAHVLLCIAKSPRCASERWHIGWGSPSGPSSGSWPTSRRRLPRAREGRRNRYEVHLDRPLRHSVESHREVGVLLNLILRPDQPDPGDPES